MRYFCVFVIQCVLISFCYSELDVAKKDRILNGFIDYLNNLPNQPYVFEEGTLVNAENTDDNTYQIEANLRVSALHNVDLKKNLRCITTVLDLGEVGISIQNNDFHCLETPPEPTTPAPTQTEAYTSIFDEVVTESMAGTPAQEELEHRPLQLDNEVQPNNVVTSGEQFIAIPREQPAPCIGCSTHVSPQAAGVDELANLCIKHLDRHEPNVKHFLNTVIDVERQVQAVNGVRYILIVTVDYNNCTSTETEGCASQVPCKISVLEKPWVKLPDGSKYRAILSNNCTEEWLFGDNGEVISENSNNKENNDININPGNKSEDDDPSKANSEGKTNANTGPNNDVVKVVHNTDLQAQQNEEIIFTDEEIKLLQEQIIPNEQFQRPSNKNDETIHVEYEKGDGTEHISRSQDFTEHAVQPQTEEHFHEHSATAKIPHEKDPPASISDDKKKVIEDMMNFFNFAGINIKPDQSDEHTRMKRSFESDLKTMSIIEKYNKLRTKLHNAKYLHELGQTMVDYLNEMDLEVKSRILKEVIAAEEEFENNQHFFYIQARVTIPCDKAQCESKDTQMKICNAVIDNSNKHSPQVLNVFCYDEQKKKPHLGKILEIPLDDPVLLSLTNLAVKKIESENSYPNALKIKKIFSAITQKVSGTLTKISVIFEFTNCSKKLSLPRRINCTALENMGTKICEVEIHERHWLKEKKITYTCTERPADESFSSTKHVTTDKSIKDSKILEIVQEALAYLEVQSNKNNKQKIVEVQSVSTQLVAGLLTKVKFVVGYTICTNDDEVDIKTCKLLENIPLRKCQVQVWDRPWLEEGKQVKVSCNDTNETSEKLKSRKKRSSDVKLVGGKSELDKTNPEFLTLAEESLQKYLQDTGSVQHHRVIKVKKVTIQAVQGKLTKIDFTASPTTCELDANGRPTSSDCLVPSSVDLINCHSKVWERTGMHSKEINVECFHRENKLRRKRAKVLGGQSEQNPNDPLYKELAQESLVQYMQSSGITQYHKLIKINKVTKQTVAGSLTRIYFSISPTNCQVDVNGQPTASDCQVIDSGDTISCQSDVWERPWLKKKEITINCTIDQVHSKQKRHLLGADKEQNLDDSKYRVLAEESLTKYLQTSGSTQHHKVIQIQNVKTQSVSGLLTKLHFTASPTNCKVEKNGQPLLTSDCKVVDPEDVINCHSDVWERPWLQIKDITVDCIANDRKIRSVPGGDMEKDPNNPKYKELAEQSLAKYLQTSGQQHNMAIKVERVTVQVVQGRLTKIDFKASPINCESQNNGQSSSSDCKDQNLSDTISCHADIWERPWLHSKEIKVECTLGNHSSRKKRNSENVVVGGLTEQNLNDPKYLLLVRESMRKYLLSTGNKRVHKLVELERVSTQVVAGVITRLDFKISPTNCLAEDEKSLYNCDVDESHVIKCHSEVWERPWLKEDNKLIEVSCEELGENTPKSASGLANDKNENPDLKFVNSMASLTSPNHSLRTVRAPKGISRPGGREEQDPSKYEFRLLAEESLRKYQHLQKSPVNHKIIEVNRVVKQVVSGLKYIIDYTATPESCSNASKCNMNGTNVILYCRTEIWSRPWLRTKDIDVTCNRDVSEESGESDEDDKGERHKRSLGRANEKDVNDAKYKLLAEEATHKYQGMISAEYAHKVIKINHVSEQVVAGFITKINYLITPTKCRIRDNQDIEECEEQTPGVVLRCNAEIWETNLNKKDINVGCKKRKNKANAKPSHSRQKRDLGVVREKRQAFGDDDYVDDEMKYYYGNQVMSEINKNSDTENLYKLITIHAMQRSTHMKTVMVRMYVEIAMTYCLRHGESNDLNECDEIEGMNHRLCLARLWPSPDEELVVFQVNVICDDDRNFESVSGLSVVQLIKAAIEDIEKSPEIMYKLVHQGEPSLVPSFESRTPIKLSFVVATTNCSKDIDHNKYRHLCFIDAHRPSKTCHAYIYMAPNTRNIQRIITKCNEPSLLRKRRFVSMDPTNATTDDLIIQKLVEESLEKLEMQSLHRYKQRVLLINSYSSKITTGKVTTIDFDVGYTNCLKYEWVDNITSCEFLEHLPRRHCVSQVYERLWLHNGRNIEVNCEDDETPLEAHIEFESAENAMQLANEALKHIEAKYPHPRRQKVVRIFTLEKQEIAGLHYRMKIEVGFTDCMALSVNTNCKLVNDVGLNKFCRVNVWLRPWTDHPPSYRVTCDYQEAATAEIYHHLQAEQLFTDFLVTYKPEYYNDHIEMMKRFEIFKKNVRKIHEFNIYERGTARYAVTRFADLTPEEFSARYLGLKPKLQDMNQVPMRMATIPLVQLPEKFDWRDYDAVTEVKDQGSCGSCWAFSVTGNIEGQWKMQSGQLVSLSEQELVDCDKLDEGCNGGLPDNAYRAIEQLGGLEKESDYPYEGENDKCFFNKTLSKVQISGALNISSNETDMAKWLVQNGPISIGINANAMQFYMGGISHPWKMLCNPSNLDHGVLIVGFGVKNYPLFHKRLPYWIVKNSWGKSWGEQGYYRVFRGDGTCGVNQMASSAII